jgi:hypothetical protein
MRPDPRHLRHLARAAAVLAVSALGHAAVFVGPTLTRGPKVVAEVARSAHLAERAGAAARPVIVAAERRALVEKARADRAAGTLSLGEFLLQASAIDAKEQGRALDLPRARQLWEARLAKLKAAEGDLRRTVPAVFGDLHYLGRAGGDIGQALLEGGGSCEPLAHLIAAAVHDAGHPGQAWLRFYGGGAEGGATHLAPVYGNEDGSGEWDLLTATPARPGGALFQAEELVEVYARAHDLAPPLADLAGPGGGGDAAPGNDGDAAPEPPARTMASGYPPNRDRFPGAVPLFADRAVQAPSAEGGAPRAPVFDPADCAFFVRVAALDPPRLGVAGERGDAFGVELRRVPSGPQMDRIFGLVLAVERALAGHDAQEPADKAMDLACLAALYDQAAVGFGLRDERDMANLAATRGRDAAAAGERLLAGVDWSGPEGGKLLARLASEYAGRAWILLVLRGGEVPLLRLGGDAGRADWGRTSALAALMIAPGTRREALRMVEALTQRQKLEVMHEVFHAHDHQRPWASNYALDGGDGEFARVYRVFRALAWGLWEGARPQEEVLGTLLREAERERIGRFWVEALLDYYGRNALALHSNRPDGRVFAGTLKRWLREHGFTELELYRWGLADAEEPT